tara:strand:- start:13501 stop:13737 length:237 start_codon:yes stop_codon:yes gene_type:complete
MNVLGLALASSLLVSSDPVVDVPPTAHEKWVKAYKEELGEEVIVDLIREVRALSAEARTPQFEKLVTTVDAIDARFPD